MKIEVGKAYRARKGDKVTIIEKDDLQPDYPFWSEEKHYSFFPNGHAHHPSDESPDDLIAEWTDEHDAEPVVTVTNVQVDLPDGPKYSAGDLVTIRLDKQDASNLNTGDDGMCYWQKSQIVSHTPAPFDWADVKPGMAFKYAAGDDVWIYCGPWIRRESSGEYTTKERRGFFQQIGSLANATDISFDALTRAPEHDIEVAV